MSNLALIASMTNNDRSNTSRAMNNMTMFVVVGITILAIYLAIRDISLQVHTSTKVWVMLLAIFEPLFFVILHGISTSLSGVNFFQSSPIVGSPSLPSLGGSIDMSAVPSVSNTLGSLASSLTTSPSSLGL